jgi:conjugal transfer pilus assembly protein TrbC
MSTMNDALRVGMVLLAGAAGAVASAGPATAGETQSGHADLARELAEEISAGSADETLGAWSQSVIEQVLERAGSDAGTPSGGEGAMSPSMFRRHAETVGSKGAVTAEVLLFTSLAVPAASWRSLARDAARIGAPLVLRGMAAESLPATARRTAGRLGDAKVGVAIDPRLFQLFGIARVPAVVVVPGGVPPCRSRGCADDAPPPFDRVTGNLTLAAALEAIASEGSDGSAVARRHLATLRGTWQ